MDAVEQAILADVVLHENGCWTFNGPRLCNVIRVVADLYGKPLPVNTRLYRMPECELGLKCVNPSHVGTSEQWMRRVKSRRRPKTSSD